MTSTADMNQIKLAMLRMLDTTLRQNYHQSLIEVLNELRMRSIISPPDPPPDKIFSVILQTHVLTYKPSPSVLRIREALERMTCGKYGLCLGCGKELQVESLLKDPTVSYCAHCQAKANS